MFVRFEFLTVVSRPPTEQGRKHKKGGHCQRTVPASQDKTLFSSISTLRCVLSSRMLPARYFKTDRRAYHLVYFDFKITEVCLAGSW